MNKEQFLKKLKTSLKRFDSQEIEKALAYYDEIICDKVEQGYSESEAIEKLGNIESISKEIQLYLLNARAEEPATLRKRASSAYIALLLLASPALLPVAIVLFVFFFVVVTVSVCLMVAFLASSVALIVGIIPTIIYGLSISAVSGFELLIGVSALLITGSIFGFLGAGFYSLTKVIFNCIAKLATRRAKRVDKEAV